MDGREIGNTISSALTRSRRRILLFSLAFGLAIWTVDAFLDWMFFYDAPFTALLVTDVPVHELYVRSVLIASFLLFGTIVWRLVRDLQARDADSSLFRTLIDESNDSVFVIDEDTGRFLDVNKQACEVLGYDREELLEMGVPDIQMRIRDEPDFQRFIRSKEGREFKNKRFAHRRADGSVVPVEISASSVEVNGVTYRIAIARDISERVSIDERRRESEEKYRSLFNSIRDAILVADTDRRIVECNPAFTSLFGYDLDEIVGKPTHYIYENDDEFEHIGNELAGGDPDSNFFVTINYQRKSGEVFPGETNVFYLLDDEDNVEGFVGLIRDVSEQHQRDQQLKVIDRILRHNLRNSLNIIMGNAEIIGERANNEISEATKRIETTGRHLIELAEKERKIVNLLTGETPQVQFDLQNVCTTVSDRSKAEYPGTTITVSVSEGLQIHAVKNFDEALFELVENSVKHSDRPDPAISIEASRVNGNVSIRISDNGPGIPAEDVQVLMGREIMDPLSHGSGLGLWLVNLIVTRSNGTIEYETGPNGGGRVELLLPVATEFT